MFIIKGALRTMARRKFKSAMVLAVSLVLVLFINMYSETISKHQATLVELHENIEVTGYITGAEANQVEDLNLDADIIQDLEGSGFISRGLYTLNRVNVIHILTARE